MRALLLVAVTLASACPSDPCTETEPAYGGIGNDEVWLTLRDAKSRATTGGDAAVITAPAAGEVFAKSGAPPTITWESPLKLSSNVDVAPPGKIVGGGPAPRIIRALSALLIPSAHAHLPPVSSDAYLVQLTVAGRECPVEIVTTNLSHTLDAARFAELGGDVVIDITSAYLASGRISEGPFASAPVTFKVE